MADDRSDAALPDPTAAAVALAVRMRAGAPIFGTHVASTSPTWVPALGGLGLDFVFIDTEHVPIGRETLAWMCRAYGALGIAPIVRIPAPDPYQACMVLDGGAAGVVAPYVESAHEARSLVGAVKYRPLKGQRLQRALAGEPLEPGLARYLASRNRGRLLLLNIESVPAMTALDDILAVDGVDGVLVGPHDLSVSLGIPEGYRDPIFIGAVARILAAARACSIGAGVHVFYPDPHCEQAEWVAAGANIVLRGSDAALAAGTLSGDLDAIRGRCGGSRAPRRAQPLVI